MCFIDRIERNIYEYLFFRQYKCGIKDYTFLTNAYTFLPKIAEVAKNRSARIIVSLDSGCKETFQKIKNSDKFDDVVSNIVEYAKPNIEIIFKYIILKGINDNFDELKKFCNTIINVINRAGNQGGFVAMIDIDYRDILKPNYVMPQEHKELIEYLLEWGKNKNLDVVMQDHIKNLYF